MGVIVSHKQPPMTTGALTAVHSAVLLHMIFSTLKRWGEFNILYDRQPPTSSRRTLVFFWTSWRWSELPTEQHCKSCGHEALWLLTVALLSYLLIFLNPVLFQRFLWKHLEAILIDLRRPQAAWRSVGGRTVWHTKEKKKKTSSKERTSSYWTYEEIREDSVVASHVHLSSSHPRLKRENLSDVGDLILSCMCERAFREYSHCPWFFHEGASHVVPCVK